MPAARGTSESKSMMIALVLFVVLFLGAAVAAVVLYMGRAETQSARVQAEQRLAEIAGTREIQDLRALQPERGQSAASVLIANLRSVGEAVLGQGLDQASPGAIAAEVESAMGPVSEQLEQLEAMQLLPQGQLSVERGLASLVRTLADTTMNLMGRLATAELERQRSAEQYEQRAQGLQAQVDELTTRLTAADSRAQELEQMYENLQEQSTAQYEQVIGRLRSDMQELQQESTQLTQQNQQLSEQIETCQSTVGQLNQRLGQFQPRPETEMAAMQPDGRVISVDEVERVAYINLARGDQVYRGLKFTVYDRLRGMPRSGRGKGAVEVIEVLDSISKCRITDMDATNPIMEGDTIANLVWDRDKKYDFAVSGMFDFDGDGEPDQEGRERVVQLIEAWGGQVTETVSVETDFFVVGLEPRVPARPAAEYAGGQVMQAYEEAQARAQRYSQNRATAEALGVPTFNLSRFLYFIGYYRQAQVAAG